MVLAISNRMLCKEPFLERVKKIAKEKKADYFILREKDLSSEDYLALAAQCLEIFDGSGVRFLIHKDIKAALALGVDAIHLPLPVFKERFLALPEQIRVRFSLVGVSVHAAQEAVFVEKNGGSYVTAGHVFSTQCKRGLAPRGLGFLEEVCKSVEIPVYAIGGITVENAAQALGVGAAGVAVMSGFMTMV